MCIPFAFRHFWREASWKLLYMYYLRFSAWQITTHQRLKTTCMFFFKVTVSEGQEYGMDWLDPPHQRISKAVVKVSARAEVSFDGSTGKESAANPFMWFLTGSNSIQAVGLRVSVSSWLLTRDSTPRFLSCGPSALGNSLYQSQ